MVLENASNTQLHSKVFGTIGTLWNGQTQAFYYCPVVGALI